MTRLADWFPQNNGGEMLKFWTFFKALVFVEVLRQDALRAIRFGGTVALVAVAETGFTSLCTQFCVVSDDRAAQNALLLLIFKAVRRTGQAIEFSVKKAGLARRMAVHTFGVQLIGVVFFRAFRNTALLVFDVQEFDHTDQAVRL